MKKEKDTQKKVIRRKSRKVISIILIVITCIIICYLILSKIWPRMTFIGHASIKIKAATGEVIYIDPYFPVNIFYKEPADYILITHGHSDHNKPSLCNKKEGCVTITWREALVDGEYKSFDFDNVKIEAVPSGGNSNHSLNNNVGYIVTVNGKSVYHSGDTSFAEETKCIADKKIDYAMYTVNGTYTMGPEEAAKMADYIGAKVNIPIHGNGDSYRKQFDEFNPGGKRKLHILQTIFLK